MSIEKIKGFARVWLLTVSALLCASVLIAAPMWWTDRNVLEGGQTGDHFSTVNQGQLMHIAEQAYLEMEDTLPGGAGTNIINLISNEFPLVTNYYATVNIGQLKYVAGHFYDRLIEIGQTNAYPWDVGITNEHYRYANVGQVKALFDFELSDGDVDNDGLDDAWEIIHFGDITSQDGSGDPDGDGLDNAGEFAAGTDPNDPDTDGDGLNDGWEVIYSDPLVPDTNTSADTDGDGLTTLEESQAGTNPSNRFDGLEDKDGDRVAQPLRDSLRV